MALEKRKPADKSGKGKLRVFPPEKLVLFRSNREVGFLMCGFSGRIPAACNSNLI